MLGDPGVFTSATFDQDEQRRPAATNVIGDRRTSLIMDPPNGRFPPLTDAGEERARVDWEGDTLVVETANFDIKRSWRGSFQFPRAVILFELPDVLHRAVIAFDVALRHRVIRCLTGVGDLVCLEIVRQSLET